MKLSQNDTGRAFEYGIAIAFHKHLPAPLRKNKQLITAKECFGRCEFDEQRNIILSSQEAISFLTAHDNRLSDTGCTVYLQSDQRGEIGDVRDIVVNNANLNKEIGVSAKNRNRAVKNSRLSDSIDFGTDWFDVRCSQNYFHTVTPIFAELRTRHRRKEQWKDIPDKMQRFYQPILQAFQIEIKSLFKSNTLKVSQGLVQYLLGRFDYYQVVKENGTVLITSFNMSGTLKWGKRVPLPTQIISVEEKNNTTLMMVFNKGWQISFRIHSATTIVEPSLKFDIQIVGFPQGTSQHVISYG